MPTKGNPVTIGSGFGAIETALIVLDVVVLGIVLGYLGWFF